MSFFPQKSSFFPLNPVMLNPPCGARPLIQGAMAIMQKQHKLGFPQNCLPKTILQTTKANKLFSHRKMMPGKILRQILQLIQLLDQRKKLFATDPKKH